MTSLNSLFDGIYCINLDACIDRKRNIENEFKEINSTVTFITAISPLHKEYTALHKTNKVDKGVHYRCYCLEECKHYPRKLRETEIAISMSHYKAYHKMVEDNVQLGLIIEDDIQFHSDVIEIIKHMYTEIEKCMLEPCIIFCGGRNNPNLSINDLNKFQLIPKTTGVYSNYCYIINNSGAKKLVKHFYPINRPEDSYKRYIISKDILKCYHLIPSIVSELSAGINAKPVFDRLSKKESIVSFQKALATTEKVDVSTIKRNKTVNNISSQPTLKPIQLKSNKKHKTHNSIIRVSNKSSSNKTNNKPKIKKHIKINGLKNNHNIKKHDKKSHKNTQQITIPIPPALPDANITISNSIIINPDVQDKNITKKDTKQSNKKLLSKKRKLSTMRSIKKSLYKSKHKKHH